MDQRTDLTKPHLARLPTRTPSQRVTAGNAFVTTLYVTNIHCQSCVSYAKDVLKHITEATQVDVSIVDHSIRVEHREDVVDQIRKELTDAAFEVQHLKTLDSRGTVIREYNPPRVARREWVGTHTSSKAQRRHMDNCNACKAQTAKNGTSSTNNMSRLFHWPRQSRRNAVHGQQEKPVAIDIDRPSQEHSQDPGDTTFTAMIRIGGIIHASRGGALTKELESLEYVSSVHVSLVSNNVIVKFTGPKKNIDTVIEVIEDVGYKATLDKVTASRPTSPLQDTAHTNFKVLLSIEGMTCGSCVGTIARGLHEFPFISNVNIDLIGCNGVVEFEGKDSLEQILEKIDDLGYDAAVVKLESTDASSTDNDRVAERTVRIAIDGMYCEHCPERIMKAFRDTVGDSVAIHQQPALKNPCLGLTYTPQLPDLTLRRFVSIINSTHEAFSATIDRPPSIEERSRAIQHREQRHILLRLLFTFCVAIPTFIIGIVYMSLVSSHNRTRLWFEQPVWAGQVSRTEWAMFIMTTPVMFFGADVFHVRAFKELRALWRPGSKVPIVRRFYRFGSMNLLISAGTGVAYFSSLAVLILDACSRPAPGGGGRGNNTYFDSVTFLSFFILIGKFIEAYSKAKTGDAVAMLSNLRPSEAVLVESVKSDNSDEVITTRVAVDLLEVGDVVNVLHGTSPPADGVVDQPGTFVFDESSLTGESKPVNKVAGQKVFAGSVNISHPVRVRVTEIGGTSMLDQIVAVVREGQTKRAPIERVADLVTGYFVPAITFIAISTFVIWLALGESGTLPELWLDVAQGGWPFWAVEFAISVFVVACPCGIALAGPTALFVGGGLAAKHGILVQGGGEAFQEASKLDAIVFDKTGTLTEGKMKVTDCKTLTTAQDEDDPDEILIAYALARALEESSNHPIARAVVDFCVEKQQQRPSSTYQVVEGRVEEIPGKGIHGVFKVCHSAAGSGHVRSYEAGIGNRRLFAAAEHATESNYFLDATLSTFQHLGHSVAIFYLRRLSDTTSDGQELQQQKHKQQQSTGEIAHEPIRPALVFAISDPLRANAVEILRVLQAQHNVSVHMCTGDNEVTARAIASQVGIPASRIRAGVLPQDKAAYIQELQQIKGRRRVVAFVGDGTNDAAALAAADVSIALSSGSDVAINSASFILLNSDLQTVLELVRLAKRVFWRVKANFVWAAVYNVALVPVAAGVFYAIGNHWRLGPVWSSAAMAASSVSVVTSSLALRLPEIRWQQQR